MPKILMMAESPHKIKQTMNRAFSPESFRHPNSLADGQGCNGPAPLALSKETGCCLLG
jgi:hypothetical protein